MIQSAANMAANADREDPLGRLCGCRFFGRRWKGFKLRTSVLFYALLILALSCFCVVGIFSDDVRCLAGGYSHFGRKLSGTMGVCGIIFCLIGTLGLSDNCSFHIRVFWYFVLARFVALIALLVVDMIAQSGCQTYALSPGAVAALQQEVDNTTFQKRLASSIPGVAALAIGFEKNATFILAVTKDESWATDIKPDFIKKQLARHLHTIAPDDISINADVVDKNKFVVTVWRPIGKTGLEYNATLMYLRQHNYCGAERGWYAWKSAIDIALCFYAIFPIWRLWWSLQYPTYLLTFTKDPIFDESTPLLK